MTGGRVEEVGLSQRMLTAVDVQAMWFLDKNGEPVVSVDWILENVPRLQLSKKVVRFRADDVELFLASKVRAA